MVGTAALLAVAAVLGLAVGTLLRRSAGAVTAVIAGIVLPYLLATVPGILPAGAEQWLLRVTPAAAFAVQQTIHAVPPGHTRSTRRARVLPAGAVGRVRGAVRLGRGRPRPRAVPAPPEGRVTDVVHAEWTKLRTLPGTGWLLLAAAALTAAVGAVAANSVTCPAGGCQLDPAKVSLTGIYLGQAIVAIVAVTVISGEYSTGMIRLTLAATPRRWRVLAAKAAVVSAATLATGAVAVLASVLAGGLLLARHGVTAAHGYQALSLGNGPVLRAAAGSVLYLALIALLEPRRRRRGPGLRGGDRGRAGAALPVSHRVERDHQPGLAPAPGAAQPDDGRACTSRPPRTCARCRSPRGRASACWPPGRPGRCWPGPWLLRFRDA